jgi:hypothetical protein
MKVLALSVALSLSLSPSPPPLAIVPDLQSLLLLEISDWGIFQLYHFLQVNGNIASILCPSQFLYLQNNIENNTSQVSVKIMSNMHIVSQNKITVVIKLHKAK